MSEQRYVVSLLDGRWMGNNGAPVTRLKDAWKGPRRGAYEYSIVHGGVALRLKPSARAAELAKLRAEVEELRVSLADATSQRDRKWAEAKKARAERDAIQQQFSEHLHTFNRVHVPEMAKVVAERDALAAQLASLLPEVTDEQLASSFRYAMDAAPYGGAWVSTMVKEARRLLRGPAAPVRPLDELRKELYMAWSEHQDWDAIAKRARELGAR